MDKSAIDIYLTLRYIPVSSPIQKSMKRLSSFYRTGKHRLNYEFNIYVQKVKEILLDNIERELAGESKVALFLSGGIDSSAILAALSKFNVGVKTYTLGFSEDDPDLLYSRRLAKLYSTDHNEIILKDFPKKLFKKIVDDMDFPNGDPTLIPTRILIENVDDVKKIFVGEGGDEVFGGYPEFKSISLGKYLSMFPSFLKNIGVNLTKKEVKERGSSFFRYYNRNPSKSFLYLKSVFIPEEKIELYTADFKKGLKIEDGSIFNFTHDLDYLQNVMKFYLGNQLPNRLMPKYSTNKFKICFPMLDERMVELMSPVSMKYKFDLCRGKDKKVLRKSMESELPNFILNRKKRGFVVPVEKWMKGKLAEEVRRTLSETRIKKKGMFNWKFVELVIKNYGKSFYWRNKLWCLFVLERWLEEHG